MNTIPTNIIGKMSALKINNDIKEPDNTSEFDYDNSFDQLYGHNIINSNIFKIESIKNIQCVLKNLQKYACYNVDDFENITLLIDTNPHSIHFENLREMIHLIKKIIDDNEKYSHSIVGLCRDSVMKEKSIQKAKKLLTDLNL